MKIVRAGYDQMQRAPTKTIAFDGTAGNGAVGTVDIWTITGRVILFHGTTFCSETCVSTSNTGTIALGFTGTSNGFLDVLTVGAGTLAANDWWGQSGPTAAGIGTDWIGGLGYLAWGLSNSIILTVATNAITDGTLVFDCFYIPLTAGAGLA